MDIDCDGVKTEQCNSKTDPSYQPETSLPTSGGTPFDAAAMPYVVLPKPSKLWSYSASNIQKGAVVAVIYGNNVEYGVFADSGPANIIGEASYAMAKLLGINPDPAKGGVDSGVTYLVFTSSKVTPPESHSAAVALGRKRAQEFVASN